MSRIAHDPLLQVIKTMKTIGSLLAGLIINIWISASHATVLAFHVYVPTSVFNPESLRVAGTVLIHIEENPSGEKAVTRIVIPKPLAIPKTRTSLLTSNPPTPSSERPRRPIAQIKERNKLLGNKGKVIKQNKLAKSCKNSIESLPQLIERTSENSTVVTRTINFKDNKITDISPLQNELGQILDPDESQLYEALGKNKKDSTGHLLQKLLSKDLWKKPDVLGRLQELIAKTDVSNDFDPIFGTNCRYTIDLFTSQAFGLFGLVLMPDDQPEHAIYLDFVPLPSLKPEELTALQRLSNWAQIETEIYEYCNSRFEHVSNSAQASASAPEPDYVQMASSGGATPDSLPPQLQFASASASGASNTLDPSLFHQPYIHTMPYNQAHQFHSSTTATPPGLATVPETESGFIYPAYHPTSLPISIDSRRERGHGRGHTSPPSAASSHSPASDPFTFNPASPALSPFHSSLPREPHYQTPRSLGLSSVSSPDESTSGSTRPPSQNEQSSQEDFVFISSPITTEGGYQPGPQTTPVLIPGGRTGQNRAVSSRTRTRASASSGGRGRSQGYHSAGGSSSAPPSTDDYIRVISVGNRHQLIAPEDLQPSSDSGIQFPGLQVEEREERRRPRRREGDYVNHLMQFVDSSTMPVHRNAYENADTKSTDSSTMPVHRPVYENWGNGQNYENWGNKQNYDNIDLKKGKERQRKKEEEAAAALHGLSITEKLRMAGKLPYNPDDDDPAAGGGTSPVGSLSPAAGHIYYQQASTKGSDGSGKTSSTEKTKEAANLNMSGHKAVINHTDFFQGIISDARNRPALLAPALFMRSKIK